MNILFAKVIITPIHQIQQFVFSFISFQIVYWIFYEIIFMFYFSIFIKSTIDPKIFYYHKFKDIFYLFALYTLTGKYIHHVFLCIIEDKWKFVFLLLRKYDINVYSWLVVIWLTVIEIICILSSEKPKHSVNGKRYANIQNIHSQSKTWLLTK